MPFPGTAIRRLTETGDVILVAVSPDGRRFAAVHREGPLSRLWIDRVGGGERRALTHAAGIHFRGLTFSPSGDTLYYVAAESDRLLSALYRVPLDDESDEIPPPERLIPERLIPERLIPERLIEDVDSPVTFSPDGFHLAFVRHDPRAYETSLIVGGADGLNLRPLSTRRRPEFYSLSGPAWSPDGEKIAVVASDGEGRMTVVEIEAATGAERRRGGEGWRRLGAIAWARNGGDLFVVGWDGDPFSYGDQIWRVSPTAEAQRVTGDECAYQGLSLTAAAAALSTVSVNRRSRIWIGGEIGKDGQPSAATPVTPEAIEGAGAHVALDWMPDGGLLYSANLGQSAGLWITNPDGLAPRPLIENAAMPAVSPDGRRIAFVSARGRSSASGGAALWLHDLVRQTTERLTSGRGELAPVFSGDGKWLIYEAPVAGRSRLWRIPAAGGAAEQMTDYFAARPSISPDGHWMAFYYLDDQGTGMKIAIAPFDPDVVRLPTPARTFHHPPPSPPLLRWTPESRAVVYCVTRHGVSNLWAQAIHGDPPRRLTQFDSGLIFGFAWSRDGRRLACTRGRIESDAVLITDLN